MDGREVSQTINSINLLPTCDMSVIPPVPAVIDVEMTSDNSEKCNPMIQKTPDAPSDKKIFSDLESSSTPNPNRNEKSTNDVLNVPASVSFSQEESIFSSLQYPPSVSPKKSNTVRRSSPLKSNSKSVVSSCHSTGKDQRKKIKFKFSVQKEHKLPNNSEEVKEVSNTSECQEPLVMPSYSCDKCSYKGPTHRSVQAHVWQIHRNKNKRVKNNRPKKFFNKTQEKGSAIVSNMSSLNIRCEHCSFIATSKTLPKMLEHVENAHSSIESKKPWKYFPCQLCSFRSKSFISLQRHFSVKHKRCKPLSLKNFRNIDIFPSEKKTLKRRALQPKKINSSKQASGIKCSVEKQKLTGKVLYTKTGNKAKLVKNTTQSSISLPSEKGSSDVISDVIPAQLQKVPLTFSSDNRNVAQNTGNKKTSFRCKYCSFTSQKLLTMKKHREAKHKNCTKSNLKMTAKQNLKRSSTSVTDTDYKNGDENLSNPIPTKRACFQCTICSFVCFADGDFDLHMKDLHPPKTNPSIQTALTIEGNNSNNSNLESEANKISNQNNLSKIMPGNTVPVSSYANDSRQLFSFSIRCQLCNFQTSGKALHKMKNHVDRFHPSISDQTIWKYFPCQCCSFRSLSFHGLRNHWYKNHRDFYPLSMHSYHNVDLFPSTENKLNAIPLIKKETIMLTKESCSGDKTTLPVHGTSAILNGNSCLKVTTNQLVAKDWTENKKELVQASNTYAVKPEAKSRKKKPVTSSITNRFRCKTCSFWSKTRSRLTSHIWKKHKVSRKNINLRSNTNQQELPPTNISSKDNKGILIQKMDEIPIELSVSHPNVNNTSNKSIKPCLPVTETEIKTSTICMHNPDKTESSSHQLKCESCDFQSSSQVSMSSHVKINHDKLSNAIVTSNGVNGEKLFKCRICGIQRQTFRGFHKHVCETTGPILKCSYCQFSTRREISYRLHLIACEKAAKRYYKNERKRQLRKQKDFQKPAPTVEMPSSSEPLNPISNSTNVKPFHCCFCPYLSLLLDPLVHHIEGNHSIKIYRCSYCFESFPNSSELSDHLKSHTKDLRTKPIATSTETAQVSLPSSLKFNSNSRQPCISSSIHQTSTFTQSKTRVQDEEDSDSIKIEKLHPSFKTIDVDVDQDSPVIISSHSVVMSNNPEMEPLSKNVEYPITKKAENHIISKKAENHIISKKAEDHITKKVEDHITKKVEDHITKKIEDHVSKKIEDHITHKVEDHITIYDSDEEPPQLYPCHICTAVFENFKEFDVHARLHLPTIKFQDGFGDRSSNLNS